MKKQHWAIIIVILALIGFVLWRKQKMRGVVVNPAGNNPYGANYQGGFSPTAASMATGS